MYRDAMRSLVILALLCGIAAAQPPEPAKAGVPAVVPDRPQSGLRLAGLVTGSMGIAAVGIGVVFAVTASAKADELTDAPVWDQQLYDGGKLVDRNAKIMFGVGGAAIIGGTIMFILGSRAAAESTGVSVAPARGGATLVWSCEL